MKKETGLKTLKEINLIEIIEEDGKSFVRKTLYNEEDLRQEAINRIKYYNKKADSTDFVEKEKYISKINVLEEFFNITKKYLK